MVKMYAIWISNSELRKSAPLFVGRHATEVRAWASAVFNHVANHNQSSSAPTVCEVHVKVQTNKPPKTRQNAVIKQQARPERNVSLAVILDDRQANKEPIHPLPAHTHTQATSSSNVGLLSKQKHNPNKSNNSTTKSPPRPQYILYL
jgi:hypothetical protein